MKKIKIEVIHDVVCSWCPIGIKNIRTALETLNKQIEAEIIYLPFELNPTMPSEGETIEAHLMRRNEWTKDQYLTYRKSLIETASKAGLIYDFNRRTHYYNTAKAHRLIHYAQNFNKQGAIVDALTEKYFTQGWNISKTEILLDIATSTGLNRKRAKQAIQSGESIQEKYKRASNITTGSVPAFVINEELIHGSNSVDFFINIFNR